MEAAADSTPTRTLLDWGRADANPDQRTRSTWIRDAVADELRALGWSRYADWQWVKDAERWSLEVNVICASPHFSVCQKTGLDHPIMYDHGKMERGYTWAKKARGALRTYLTVLAYMPASDFQERNGVYRLDSSTLLKRYVEDGSRVHKCTQVCTTTDHNRLWHMPHEALRTVTDWEQLRGR